MSTTVFCSTSECAHNEEGQCTKACISLVRIANVTYEGKVYYCYDDTTRKKRP